MAQLDGITSYTVTDKRAVYVKPITKYTIRQLRYLYRMFWPARGQRFPIGRVEYVKREL